MLLQKEAAIDPDDTVGTLYFDKLFPLGVDAMVESVELVEQGTAPRIMQDESQATYEAIFKGEHAAIDWSKPGRQVYDLIRGCTPQPGAATTIKGQQVEFFESRFNAGASSSEPGQLMGISDDGLEVAVAGGTLLVQRVRVSGGQKVAGAQLATDLELGVGGPVRGVRGGFSLSNVLDEVEVQEHVQFKDASRINDSYRTKRFSDHSRRDWLYSSVFDRHMVFFQTAIL